MLETKNYKFFMNKINTIVFLQKDIFTENFFKNLDPQIYQK